MRLVSPCTVYLNDYNLFYAIDTFLTRPGSDLQHLALTKKEWEVVNELACILSRSLHLHLVIIIDIVLVPPATSN
jgi:hypothetical protein